MYASNLGVKQYNISSEWNDGANTTVRIEAGGRARFGTNVDSTANTFLDINPALGLATFRGAIEVLSGSSGYANLTDKPTLGSLAAGNNLDDVANGSTYARTNSTIISGGNIRVGSGTKDSSLNGWHIDSGEIVGQLAGADQVVLGTDGKIKAGTGAVTLDANGIGISASAIHESRLSYAFSDGSNNRFGFLSGTYSDSIYINQVQLKADTGGSREPEVVIIADGTAALPGTVYLRAVGLYNPAIICHGDTNVVDCIGTFAADNVMNFRST